MVRHRLPRGEYYFALTLWDRFGGKPLSVEPVRTSPSLHEDRPSDLDLVFRDVLAISAPPSQHVSIAMCFVFELFLCRGHHSPHDTPVGWAVFPLCEPSGDIIAGHFRVPLLKGPIDLTIKKYSTIEKMIADDTSRWLCNMYFKVKRLARVVADVQEDQVALARQALM